MHCTIKFAISKGNYAWSIGSLRLKVAKPVSAQNCTICTVSRGICAKTKVALMDSST